MIWIADDNCTEGLITITFQALRKRPITKNSTKALIIAITLKLYYKFSKTFKGENQNSMDP